MYPARQAYLSVLKPCVVYKSNRISADNGRNWRRQFEKKNHGKHITIDEKYRTFNFHELRSFFYHELDEIYFFDFLFVEDWFCCRRYNSIYWSRLNIWKISWKDRLRGRRLSKAVLIKIRPQNSSNIYVWFSLIMKYFSIESTPMQCTKWFVKVIFPNCTVSSICIMHSITRITLTQMWTLYGMY